MHARLGHAQEASDLIPFAPGQTGTSIFFWCNKALQQGSTLVVKVSKEFQMWKGTIGRWHNDEKPGQWPTS
jgi:hypothetical protein